MIILDMKCVFRWIKNPYDYTALINGFTWTSTPQGDYYWDDVYRKTRYNAIGVNELRRAKQHMKQNLFEYWTR